MDIDDEPSPWELEQLLFSSCDIQDGRSQGPEDGHAAQREAQVLLDSGYFSSRLKQSLDTIRKDDPLAQSAQRKPCISIPIGKS